MRIFISISLLILVSSCIKSVENNRIVDIAGDYIDAFPIGIDNYDYVIRFYKKDKDTILEINQDRIDIDLPLDFSIKLIDSSGNSNDLDYRFIKIGNTKIHKKPLFIFDTNDSIGKVFYNFLKLSKTEHKIEKLSHFNYPFLPKTRIYKVKGDNLILIKEVDTVWFK